MMTPPPRGSHFDFMNYTETFLSKVVSIANALDRRAIDDMVRLMVQTRESGGRLFILGIGGSAANASHAVNDFRKIAGIEAYAPTDSVSELTARINDDGWDSVFAQWLLTSRASKEDLILVLSVGGGNLEKQVSTNIVKALELATYKDVKVCGIVGRDGGETAKKADVCVLIPNIDPQCVTPLAESFQAVVWHLVVSHPKLKCGAMKWESTDPT